MVVFCRRLCGCSRPQRVLRSGYVLCAGPDARPGVACGQAFSGTHCTAALDPSAVTGPLAACRFRRVMARPGTGAPAWSRPGDSGSCPFVMDPGVKPVMPVPFWRKRAVAARPRRMGIGRAIRDMAFTTTHPGKMTRGKKHATPGPAKFKSRVMPPMDQARMHSVRDDRIFHHANLLNKNFLCRH